MIIVVGATAVVAITARYRREQRADTVAATSATAPTTARTTEPAAEAAAALGPAFGADLRVRPAAEAGQSKLWVHDGRWWGVLLASGEYRIHAFDPAAGWHDTGTLVDPRASAHPDVLAEENRLVVASAGRSESERNALEVRRFTYDPGSRVYRLDSGYPVRVTPLGVDHVTVARTASGTLWAAFVSAQRVQVAHTIDSDAHWSSPAQIPVAEGALPSAAVAVAASQDTVAVLWASAAGTFHVATTADGESWSARQLMGGAAPDEERTVVLRAISGAGGPRFLGLLTVEPSRADANPLATHIVMVASSGGAGEWSTYAVSRVEDRLDDPTMVVDEGDRSVAVLATAEGSVWMKQAPIDHLAFATGRGTRLIPTDLGGLFADVTGARSVPAGAGFVALASDGGAGRYAYAARGVAAPGGATLGQAPRR